jgi:cyclopropane fatty-acyl-phospholipid synthase-like methyltransferase
VTGITLSPVQVAMARELAREAGVAARFELMDAEELTLEGPFDALWMVGVLGHLPDQAGFVRRSPRLLAPRGRFVLGDWMLGEGVEPDEYGRHVEPVRRGMLMPAIHSLGETAGWFERAGYRVLSARDLSAETVRTWDLGASIVQAPALLKLAASLGRDALELVRAVRGMRAAMRAGRIVYGQVIAERA